MATPDLSSTGSATIPSASTTSSTNQSLLAQYSTFESKFDTYTRPVHFDPTILNVKRGIWHALVRTASQLHLKNNLAHKNNETNHHNWNVGWVDKASMTFYRSLTRFQKVNHLLGVEQLCRKRNLARITQHLKRVTDRKNLSDFDFMPYSWILPRDHQLLTTIMREREEKAITENKTPPAYIIKPGSSCQGRGIYLAQKIESINLNQGYVVQQYIDNPLTILGRKFDLRIYVLQTSSSPLRLYVYEDGLARFATNQYEKPSQENIEQLFTHLTNFSLNKLNKENFVDSGNDDENALGFNPLNNKWSLLQFNDYIYKTFGAERFGTMWEAINDIIIKTITTAVPVMNQAYTTLLNEQTSENNINPDNRCLGFQLYGFDIMFDEHWKPWLIEVNRNPSLRCEASVDEYIKTQLLGQLAMILDPVSSLSPSSAVIEHVAQHIMQDMLSQPSLDTLLQHTHEHFTEGYSALVETADPQAISSGSTETISPFFSTRVVDAFWNSLENQCREGLSTLSTFQNVTEDDLNTNASLMCLIIQSIFDVDRAVAKKLYRSSLLMFWTHHKNKFELQCRLQHEDRCVDILHETTLFWHSVNPPNYDNFQPQTTTTTTTATTTPTSSSSSTTKSTKSTKSASSKTTKTTMTTPSSPNNILVPPDLVARCIGSAVVGGFTPLLSQSPNYRANGFSRLIKKQATPTQTTPSLAILRDPRTNLPIYSSNFRTIFPIEPFCDYPYPIAEDQKPQFPDAEQQAQYPDLTNIDSLTKENGYPYFSSNVPHLQPITPAVDDSNRVTARAIPVFLPAVARVANQQYYTELAAVAQEACEPFLTLATREAVSSSMGLAGYPTIGWTDGQVVDERSVRELQHRRRQKEQQSSRD